jgi:hypothetical protein
MFSFIALTQITMRVAKSASKKYIVDLFIGMFEQRYDRRRIVFGF